MGGNSMQMMSFLRTNSHIHGWYRRAEHPTILRFPLNPFLRLSLLRFLCHSFAGALLLLLMTSCSPPSHIWIKTQHMRFLWSLFRFPCHNVAAVSCRRAGSDRNQSVFGWCRNNPYRIEITLWSKGDLTVSQSIILSWPTNWQCLVVFEVWWWHRQHSRSSSLILRCIC